MNGAAKTKSSKSAFTLEQARALILDKLRKAGAKGASPVTAATKEPKRSVLEQALQELEAERVVHVDRTGKKPKYLLAEFAPSVTTTAGKIAQFSARKHPELLTMLQLKKAAAKSEQPLFVEALQRLEEGGALLKLRRGKALVYAHGDSLRVMLGATPLPAGTAVEATQETSQAIRQSYADLVRLTGFPDVEIAALQRQAGVPMESLKAWLQSEHRAGRAVFGLGDWSLADERSRAGMIELRGDRYLLVRLEE